MRNPDQAPKLGDITRVESLPITISTMDVDSDESVSKAVGQIIAQYGPLDVLVNNAGIERRGSVEELCLSDFKAVMETNYFGAIRCMKAVLPGMRIQGTGCIIESDSCQFHYPVGPDAEPFLNWCAAMTDEEWIDWGAADDEEWYSAIKRDFGVDARSEL